ncbi:MAG TPA: hypothetical protein VMF59_05530, partial [Bacteroidota bacterium]|nr:hypothetical protein [Bacteroidota bacterium]
MVMLRAGVIALLCAVLDINADAQFTQQGNKLFGTGAGNADPGQGWSVALSSDGNTAIVGGIFDNHTRGASWIFTRASGLWSQQGNKLAGTGEFDDVAYQGYAVALSADGNTALVGADDDSNEVGAAWVFVRTGTTWAQQGSKLVGTNGIEIVYQGTSVSLSADGNTAFIGGPRDDNYVGAVWAFSRSGGVWTQEGNKILCTGSAGSPHLGQSVSLSGDGNT